MLIKYCIFNSTTPDITEIADVTKDGSNAVFTPIREDYFNVIVKDISGYEYERLIDMLFDHGKADITSMKDKTFLEEIDDTDEGDNSQVGKEYVDLTCADSKYGRFSTEMPQRLKKQLEELKKSGNYSMGDVVKLIDNFSENIKDE